MPTKKKRTVAAKSASARTSSAKSTSYSTALAKRFKGDIMLGTLLAEMVGTFVLTMAVLITSGNILIAALTVLVVVLAFGRLSGAHLNPAVTIGLVATKQMSVVRGLGYIVAQFFGAMLAWVVVHQFVTSAPVDALTSQAQEMFKASPLATGQDWRPFFAEALGAMVFGFGIASMALNKKEGLDAAYTVGGALLIGLLLATQASAAILNPAVAVGVGAYSTENMTTVWVYALGPIVGLTAGAWLYKLMLWDVNGRAK